MYHLATIHTEKRTDSSLASERRRRMPYVNKASRQRHRGRGAVKTQWRQSMVPFCSYTVVSRRLARVHGQFRARRRFLTVAECPSYTAVHRRRSALPCCCCPYLEQSAPTCHVHTL